MLLRSTAGSCASGVVSPHDSGDEVEFTIDTRFSVSRNPSELTVSTSTGVTHNEPNKGPNSESHSKLHDVKNFFNKGHRSQQTYKL
jgi:hypothetical protein